MTATLHRVAVAGTVEHRGPRSIELVDDMIDGDLVLVARTWRARCTRCGHDTTGLTLIDALAFLDHHPCAQDPRS